LRNNFTVEEINKYTHIDKWFLEQIREIIDCENEIKKTKDINRINLKEYKQLGFSDMKLAHFCDCKESEIRNERKTKSIEPTYKRVDTCAAEFESFTPYMYSTYEEECEVEHTDKKSVIILGSGPNRIGQGIEFDYCCVHAIFALKEEGYETIMINCNPETVSTDYDISDKLYFEPLTFENVMNIIEKEKPSGVIVQFGGQTPLKLSNALYNSGVNIIGTSPKNIDIAEDRELFKNFINSLGFLQPKSGIARNSMEAKSIADEIGYPVVVRPSYVLGGRAMEIVYDKPSLENYIEKAVVASEDHPILIDKF